MATVVSIPAQLLHFPTSHLSLNLVNMSLRMKNKTLPKQGLSTSLVFLKIPLVLDPTRCSTLLPQPMHLHLPSKPTKLLHTSPLLSHTLLCNPVPLQFPLFLTLRSHHHPQALIRSYGRTTRRSWRPSFQPSCSSKPFNHLLLHLCCLCLCCLHRSYLHASSAPTQRV